MPIVESESGQQGLSTVDTTIVAALIAAAGVSLSSTVNTSISASLTPALEIVAGSAVDTSVTAVCNGFVPPASDLFGSSTVDTGLTSELNPASILSGYSAVDTTVEGTLTPQISEAERFGVLVVADLLPARPTGGLEYSERLTVDGTELKIIDWQYRQPRGAIRYELAITLADPDDGELITRDSEITFEVGLKSLPDPDFTWYTLLDTGYANEASLQLRPPSAGADDFTFVGLSDMQQRLNRTPATDLVVYDPNLVDVDESDFRVVYDDFGRAFTTEIVAIPDLTMQLLFDEILRDRCGFSQVKTNLPVRKWRLSRVDFKAGEPYIAAIAPRIGMFDPDLDEQGGTLWIRGTGLPYPSGSPTPETIELSELVDVNVATNIRRVDAVEMLYNLWTYEYDYVSQRTENSAFSTDNNGEIVNTVVTKTINEYYRESNPTVPVHEEPASVATTEIRGDGWVMENSMERYFYRGTNRIARRKNVQVPIPTVPTGTFVLSQAATEMEDFEWTADPFRPSRIYMRRRNLKVYGMIAADYSNLQLGAAFRQQYVDAWRSGNLNENITVESGAIRSEDEITHIINRDAIEIWNIRRDHLAGVTNRSYTEQRVGDVGKPSFVNDPREMYIFDEENAARTFDRKETINIGELSPLEGIKLCRRKLKRWKTRPRSVTDTVDGIDPTFLKGTDRKLKKRDGTDLGVFAIRSVTMSGGRGGYQTSFEGDQS